MGSCVLAGQAAGWPGPVTGLCGCWDRAKGHPRGHFWGPAQSQAVSTLSSLSKPRHCPGSGICSGAALKETYKPETPLRASGRPLLPLPWSP